MLADTEITYKIVHTRKAICECRQLTRLLCVFRIVSVSRSRGIASRTLAKDGLAAKQGRHTPDVITLRSLTQLVLLILNLKL